MTDEQVKQFWRVASEIKAIQDRLAECRRQKTQYIKMLHTTQHDWATGKVAYWENEIRKVIKQYDNYIIAIF